MSATRYCPACSADPPVPHVHTCVEVSHCPHWRLSAGYGSTCCADEIVAEGAIAAVLREAQAILRRGR